MRQLLAISTWSKKEKGRESGGGEAAEIDKNSSAVTVSNWVSQRNKDRDVNK